MKAIIFCFLPVVLSLELFPYGENAGDVPVVVTKDNTNTLTYGDTDDGIKLITTPNFPFFQKKLNNKIQISTNGYIAFGKDCIFNAHIPSDFPINHEGHTLPIIAPFWADFHYAVNSTLSYQVHDSVGVLNRAKAFVLKRFSESKFHPLYVVVITWSNVYHSTDPGTVGTTFQLILTTDGKSTFVIFMYQTLPLDVAATVGFQDRLDLFRYKYSLEKEVGYHLHRTTNVEMNGVLVYRVAEEPLTCQGLPDGRHSHPTECDKYIICSYQSVIDMKRCNCSEHYHPEYKKCVPAAQYPCHRDCVKECKGKNAELVPHCCDCTKFLFCLNGEIHKIASCPRGMHYHPSLKLCVLKAHFNCKIEHREGYVPPSFCQGKPDGDYSDPSDCSSYFECKAGMFHAMTCGDGQRFNPSTKQCDWSFNVNCSVGSK